MVRKWKSPFVRLNSFRSDRAEQKANPDQWPCARIPVATENRIRAGADAAMGYPRFGMLDLLKLLSGVLVGVFRSHAARRQQRRWIPRAGRRGEHAVSPLCS